MRKFNSNKNNRLKVIAFITLIAIVIFTAIITVEDTDTYSGSMNVLEEYGSVYINDGRLLYLPSGNVENTITQRELKALTTLSNIYSIAELK